MTHTMFLTLYIIQNAVRKWGKLKDQWLSTLTEHLFGLSNSLWTFPSGSFINELNKFLASTHPIFIWGSSFQILKKLYLDTRWKQLHPRLGFIALDRSQNPGRHPKRNHCFLYTEQNDWWSLYIFGESHLIIIKINVYWVLTIAKHYSKSFTSIINALSWHNPKI